MQEGRNLVEVVLVAVALALSVASVVLGIIKAATPETQLTLLSLGLLALSMAVLQKRKA